MNGDTLSAAALEYAANDSMSALWAIFALKSEVLNLQYWKRQLHDADELSTYHSHRERLIAGALQGSKRALVGIGRAYSRARKHVVAYDHDRFGGGVGSLRELVLRCQLFAVTMQQRKITRAAQEEGWPLDYRLEAFFDHIHGKFVEISTLVEVGKRIRSEDLLCTAQRQMAAITEAPQVVAILHGGAMRAEWRTAAWAFALISVALEFCMDIPTDSVPHSPLCVSFSLEHGSA